MMNRMRARRRRNRADQSPKMRSHKKAKWIPYREVVIINREEDDEFLS